MGTLIAPPEQKTEGAAAGGRPLIGMEHLAELIGVSTQTLRRMTQSGKLPEPIRLGRLIRWKPQVIDDWIAAGCPPAKELGRMRKALAS